MKKRSNGTNAKAARGFFEVRRDLLQGGFHALQRGREKMDQIGQQQDEHRAVQFRNDLQDQNHDGQGRDRARQDVAGIGSLYAKGTGPGLPSARDVGEGNATDNGHGGGDGGKRQTVPHVAQKLPGQMTGRDGLNGPLDQEYHRDAECGREYEQQVARKQQGREGRAGLRNRFPVSTGGLIEPASLSEPAFADEKDKGARD